MRGGRTLKFSVAHLFTHSHSYSVYVTPETLKQNQIEVGDYLLTKINGVAGSILLLCSHL